MKTLGILSLVFIMASCIDYTPETRVDHRDKILGRYDVEEYSETYDEYVFYEMTVNRSYGSRKEIFLEGFYASNISVYAYVENDWITIPYQITDGYEIEGSGQYYRGKLELSYRVKDRYNNSYSDFCETVAYKY
jgi:hypothetical protein